MNGRSESTFGAAEGRITMMESVKTLLFVIKGSALNRGMNTGIENLAWGLAEKGLNVHILSGGPAPNEHPYEYPSNVEYHFTGKDGSDPLHFVDPFRDIVSQNNINAVIGWIINIAPLARLPESKRITFFANQGQMAPRSLALSQTKKVISGAIPFSHAVHIFRSAYDFTSRMSAAVSISKSAQDSCIHTYHLQESKCVVIHRGVDTNFYCYSERGATQGTPKLLYAGNVSKEKGISDLVEALSFLETPVQIFLCGNGSTKYVHALEKRLQAQGKGHYIHFTGPLKKENLVELYQTCDLFVFPSHSEGLGKALIEAMACGCPVVCSNIPTFKEIVTDGHDGHIATVKSPYSLSQAIDSLLDDPKQRKALSRNARATAIKRFSKEAELSQWLKLLERFVNKVP